MRIERIENNVAFKSGYPTFGTGHLSNKPEIFNDIYIGYKPNGILKAKKIDYLA